MNCKCCGEPLIVSKARYTSEIGSDKVILVQELVCINSKRDQNKALICPNYCGPETGKPLVIADTITSKLN